MTNSKQKLTINLDEIKNPNPAILAAYRKDNCEDLYYRDIPENVNEQRIFTLSKSSSSPIRHSITHLYRKQQASDGKEFCFFGEELYARDYWSNEISHFRTVGKFTLPIISKTYTFNPGKSVQLGDIQDMQDKREREVGISEMKEVLEFPWEDIKPQLEQWKEQGVITAETQLYIIIDNQRYGKPWTWQQWLDLPILDLLMLNRAGVKYQQMLKGAEITPEVLRVLRERLQGDLLTELAKPSTTK